MDDYISRKAALNAIYTSTAPALEVKAMPAADVAEIVRCKDCEHWMPDGENEMVCTGPMAYCNTDEAWYCAAAKRRERSDDAG